MVFSKVYRPDDQSTKEEDEAKLKAVIHRVVRVTAVETVDRYLKSVNVAVQQDTYLRKLHEATSLWVRNVANTDIKGAHLRLDTPCTKGYSDRCGLSDRPSCFT